MFKFKVLALITLGIILAGCDDPKPTQPMETVVGTPRVSIVRIGVFEDGLAYGDKRGIYLIKDAQTGQEFIGVSGVGVAETGSHSAGKSRVSDER